MKWIFFLWAFISVLSPSFAQELSPVVTQQLENLAAEEQAETEDDSYLQELSQYSKDPLNINSADRNELRTLRILTDLQIENFISYRNLLGKIVDIYELQAVPAWDIITIRRLLPFISIAIPFSINEQIGKRFKKGNHGLLVKISQVIERAKGFEHDTAYSRYTGGPQKILFRYRYSYRNLLQYGLTGDKDAGEQFFSGGQKKGFDFYSFHLFARQIGIIQSFALGDFTINMGQGLIQWQSMAFKKSAAVLNTKRQSAVLRPYSSAGEFNFHRGVGISIRKRRLEATLFISFRKLSASAIKDSSQGDMFTSFQPSGYHRTQTELDAKNTIGQTAVGMNVSYNKERLHVGCNGVFYQFTARLQKKEEPYNLFAISGNHWGNASVDYSYTYRNFHLFGEVAMDKNFHRAVLNGILISVDPKVDMSLVHRVIAKDYQAMQGNAFTENTVPSNENGIYAGLSIHPVTVLRLDSYADIYKFPWLKYGADAAASGRDFLLQLTYTPTRQAELYIRFKTETKEVNQPGAVLATKPLLFLPKQNLRLHFDCTINSGLQTGNRAELVWYDKKGENSETGFLVYTDIKYKPLAKPFSTIFRIQYFETDGYNSGLYAYESDISYSYSVPVVFGRGFRYVATLNYDLNQSISLWLRWGQTIYMGENSIGSGLEEIGAGHKTELKFQIRINL